MKKRSSRSLIAFSLAVTLGLHALFFFLFFSHILLFTPAPSHSFVKPVKQGNEEMIDAKKSAFLSEALSLIAPPPATLPKEDQDSLEIKPVVAVIEKKEEQVVAPEALRKPAAMAIPRSIYSLKYVGDPFVAPKAPLPPLAPAQFPSDAIVSSPSSIDYYRMSAPFSSLLDWSNYFQLEAVVVPDLDGRESHFLISLSPKPELYSGSAKQNFFFVLDTSNVAEKHRFASYKKALLRSLAALPPTAQFNLCVLGKKISLLSKNPLPSSKLSIDLASHFLDNPTSNTTVAATHPYLSLPLILTSSLRENENMAVILIADGRSGLNNKEQKAAIEQWTKVNQQRAALFAASVGKEANLSFLQLLAKSNGGDLRYSSTYSAFPRVLSQLVKELSTPIATQISFSLTSEEGENDPTLYLPLSRLPALYSKQSITLTGNFKESQNLYLVIHGLHVNEPFFIEKRVVFEKSCTLSSKMQKKWGELQACRYYDQFLQTGEREKMQKAQVLLNASLNYR